MADDETIVIRVNAAQGEAALKALGAAGIDAGQKIETVASPVDKVGFSIKDMTKSIGAGISIISILRDNLAALEPVQKSLAENFRAGAIDAGANAETLDNVTRALDSMVHPSHIAQNAVEALSIAFEKGAKLAQEWGFGNKKAAETAAQAWANSVGSVYAAVQAQEKLTAAVFGSKKEIAGFTDAVIQSVGALLQHGNATEEQMVRAKESIQKAIDDELTAFGKVPPALQELADKLGVVRSIQEEAAKSLAKEEEELEKAAVKSAEQRAKSEAAAADAIIAALERERQALDAKLAQDEARLQKALGAGGKIDTSKDADEAKKDVANLRDEIQQLENQPMLSVDELNKLNTLKDRAGAAASAARDLGEVFTVTREDFLTESEAADAAAAAWDVYGDRLDQAQFNHERVMDSLDGTAESFGDLGGVIDDVGSAASDLGGSLGDVGDEAKKGVDKGKESLDNLKEGLKEAIPLANELAGILQQIVTLGSQADI